MESIIESVGLLQIAIGLLVLILLFTSVRYRSEIAAAGEDDNKSGDGDDVSVGLPGGRKAVFLAFRPCICVFKFKIGRLTVDPSCRGTLRIWLIDEGAAAALQPVVTGQTYNADGFKIGGRTWKIDGSTCVTIKCTPQGVFAETCVNLIALGLGKGPPRVVPAGTFGGPPKEPAAGAVAGPAT